MGQDVVHVGQSVVIRGELSASEDLTIEGQVGPRMRRIGGGAELEGAVWCWVTSPAV